MSVLDQAFIRAFAKDRSATDSALHHDSRRSADSVSSHGDGGNHLVLHDMFARGDRLRFDVEAHADSCQSCMSLSAHVPFILESPETAVSESVGEQASGAPCELNGRTAVQDDAVPIEPHVVVSELADGQERIGLLRVAVTDLERPLVLMVPDENPACRPALSEIGRPDLASPEWGSCHGGPVQRLEVSALVHVGAIEDSRVIEYLNGTGPELDHSELDHSELDHSELDHSELDHSESDHSESDHNESDHNESAVLAVLADQAESICDSQDRTDESSKMAGSATSEDRSGEMVGDSSEEIEPSAWEVDRFHWPELCRQLDQASDGDLQGAGRELMSAAQEGLGVLAVTGTHRQEGRTTLALSLAASVANAGGRVALLDADTTTPELAVRLGVDAPCDWLAVVRQHHPVLEAGVASLEDKVTLFPLASSTDNPIDSGLFTSVLEQLRRHFDLVVIDMPPVTDGKAEFLHGSPNCPVNMALVVHNPAVTTQEQTIDAAMRLREFGIDAIGIAENGIIRQPRVA